MPEISKAPPKSRVSRIILQTETGRYTRYMHNRGMAAIAYPALVPMLSKK